MSFFGILNRTLEVYHHVHTAPIIAAWSRINLEVADQRKRVHELLSGSDSRAFPKTWQTWWLSVRPCNSGALEVPHPD